jgi:hypothetical protein
MRQASKRVPDSAEKTVRGYSQSHTPASFCYSDIDLAPGGRPWHRNRSHLSSRGQLMPPQIGQLDLGCKPYNARFLL